MEPFIFAVPKLQLYKQINWASNDQYVKRSYADALGSYIWFYNSILKQPVAIIGQEFRTTENQVYLHTSDWEVICVPP